MMTLGIKGLISLATAAAYVWATHDYLDVGFQNGLRWVVGFWLISWLVRSVLSWTYFFVSWKKTSSDNFLAGLREMNYPTPDERVLPEQYFLGLRRDSGVPVEIRIEAAADKARFDAYRIEGRGQDLIRLSMALGHALRRYRGEKAEQKGE